MTARFAVMARERASWRALVLAALAATLLGGWLTQRLRDAEGTAAPRPAAARAAAADAALTAASRAALSAAVGAKDPAYRVYSAGAALRAGNPAQHLALSFGRGGVVIAAKQLQLGLGLQAIGEGGALHAVGASTPTAAANRVAYAHAGIGEWYVNGTLGLEQGFSVARAPAAGNALTLAIAVTGNTRATLAPGGRSVAFIGAGGDSLEYGGLSASDARGHALQSSLALSGGRLLLNVDTRGARFPVRIDPLIEQKPELKLVATLGEVGEDAHYGTSVALSADGNTALIGAPGGKLAEGAAWVFRRVGSTWIQTGTKLEVPAEQEAVPCEEEPEEGGEEPEECRFAWSVALSADGSTALLGDPHANVGEGAAWVFTRSGETWSRSFKISPPVAELKGRFGRSVALSASGQTALVGAPMANAGRAWAFTRTGSSWTPMGAAISGAEESPAAGFGRSVALSGNGETALIGGPANQEGVGAAWAFERAGNSWLSEGSKLTGAGESGEGHFGSAVALSENGGTAVIGGHGDNEDHGGAWVFAQSGSGFAQQGPELTSGDGAEDMFGYGVAISPDGGSLLIGAPHASQARGAAWLYERTGTSWTATKELVGADEETGHSRFGASVALTAAVGPLLIGGPGGSDREGAAWIFGLGPAVTGVAPQSGPEAGGTAVRISGEHFTGATGVRFGSSAAASFTVESDQSITAVSPPGSGAVEVTVETPLGVSVANSHDAFKYNEKSEKRGRGTGINEETPTTGVLASGPNASATSALAGCGLALRSKTVAVIKNARALFRLVGTGIGHCSGKLRLNVRTKLANRRMGTKTIGTAVFSVLAGNRISVRLHLNAAGRALLARGRGHLNASLLIVRSSPVPRLSHSASVRLKVQTPAKHP